MALPYSKPQGFRFQNGGLSLRNTPDALQPNKYTSLVNVRDYADLAIGTRPGYTLLFNGNSIPVTDIRAYAALNTDDVPRFLARTQNNQIVLDTGVQITPLGGFAGSGISMNAFRPNGSTQSWMYCAAQADYKKIPAPTVGVPFAVKVGIAEPQVAVEYVQASPTFFNNATGVAASWTAAGTAGAPANADVLGGTGNNIGGAGGPDGTNWGVISDPQNFNRFSIGVTTGNFYLPNDIVSIGGTTNLYLVDAVLQTINQTTISNIRYDVASTGNCSIVLTSDYSNILARGSLLVLDNGTNKDVIFVQSVLSGSGNSTCVIRTSTVHTFGPGNSVFGEQTLVVYPIGAAPAPPSGTITVPVINTAITPGTGTLTQSFVGNNFAKFGLSDYIHLSFQTTSITSISNISVLFDTSDQSFTKSFFTYSLSSTALLQVLGDGLTEINIPLSVLTNQSANFGEFANVTALRISVTVNANTTFGIQAFWVGGGNGPDVGFVNSSTSNLLPGYKYLVKPRNAASSGVVGNPCPDQRYALFVHRQSILVKTSLLSSAYDPQIDTWDIYRTGGTITSYQYVGSVAVGQDFTDTLTDAGASAGQPLATDDFEPWPTIGTPVANFTNISLVGTFLTAQANSIPSPNFLLNVLPGTLLTLPPLGTFTLRSRPTNSGIVYTFELEQNAGPSAPTSIVIQEPIVANQHLQSVSGPDSNGFFFAVGDTFRPGVVYYSKAFQPDSAPEANTAELSPPNEPLIGSLIVNGLAYVYSTRRWWAAYPNVFATAAPFFNFVEQAIGETPLSPFGSTTDGSRIYFWGRKGIYVTDGTAAKSITDQDLLQLFPHEGVLGVNITVNGQIYSAPDFTQIAKFRLAIVGNYLYADYVDAGFQQHTLVYNTKSQAWVSYDIYNVPMFTHYAPLQQVGQLQGGGTPAYSDYCVMGGADGNVYLQSGTSNDAGTNISCVVQTFEWDGGDSRANIFFGDLFIDCLPRATLSVTAMQFGASTGIVDTVFASSVRTQVPLSLNGQQLQKFIGISVAWTDVTPSTTLYLWQSSVFTQPEFTIDRVTDFWDLGSAALVRGVILTADTFGGPKTLNFTDDSSNSHFITANHIGQQEIAYAFTPPFVAHELRIRPSSTGPWRFFGLKWIMDPWPELIPLYSEWLTVGPGAMYLRAATIPLDTNGAPVSLTFVGSDGTSTTLGPFTTTAAEKTEVPMAFVPPLVAHEVQIVPNAPVRIWTKEIMWVADPYTELIPAYTAIMLMNSTDNAYVMGLKLTADSGGVAVGFNVLKDGGALAATIPAQVWNGKQTIPIVFPTPFQAHNWQLQPTGSIRVFAGESKWVYQATPESMVQWGPTQATSHGQDGFHFLYSLQPAYVSTAPITLTVTSVDGASPAALVLPSSGGVAAKPTLFFTFNKGKLFIYKATSPNPFQLFLQEWSLRVGNWAGPDLVTINNLGGLFGDKAEI